MHATLHCQRRWQHHGSTCYHAPVEIALQPLLPCASRQAACFLACVLSSRHRACVRDCSPDGTRPPIPAAALAPTHIPSLSACPTAVERPRADGAALCSSSCCPPRYRYRLLERLPWPFLGARLPFAWCAVSSSTRLRWTGGKRVQSGAGAGGRRSSGGARWSSYAGKACPGRSSFTALTVSPCRRRASAASPRCPRSCTSP